MSKLGSVFYCIILISSELRMIIFYISFIKLKFKYRHSREVELPRCPHVLLIHENLAYTRNTRVSKPLKEQKFMHFLVLWYSLYEPVN